MQQVARKVEDADRILRGEAVKSAGLTVKCHGHVRLRRNICGVCHVGPVPGRFRTEPGAVAT
jgi:hypothetical protein